MAVNRQGRCDVLVVTTNAGGHMRPRGLRSGTSVAVLCVALGGCQRQAAAPRSLPAVTVEHAVSLPAPDSATATPMPSSAAPSTPAADTPTASSALSPSPTLSRSLAPATTASASTVPPGRAPAPGPLMAASLGGGEGWAFTPGHIWRGTTVLHDVTPSPAPSLTPLAYSSYAADQVSVLYGKVTSNRSALGGGDLLGAVMETTVDGGRTWSRTDVAPVPRLAGYGFWPLTEPTAALLWMSFADARHGYLVAAALDARSIPYTAIVEATDDGGAHWTPRGVSAAGPATFLDSRHGFLRPVSGQPLMRTVDGGRHWEPAAGLPADATLPVRTPYGLLTSAVTVDSRYTLYYRSTDQGASWRKITTRTPPAAFQVAQAGVGSSGQLWAEYVSTVGDGQCQLDLNVAGHWQLTPLPIELYSLQLTLGPGLLWAAIPQTVVSDDHHRLAASIDEGQTWTLTVGKPTQSKLRP